MRENRKTIMLFFYCVFVFCAVVHGEENSVFSDAAQLLGKFKESRKNLNSYVVKAREKATYTYPEFKGTGTGYRNVEFRFDGNRCKNIQYIWGDINVRDRNVKEEKADYFSMLWDGKTAYTVSKSVLHGKDTAAVTIDPDDNKKSCSDSYKDTSVGEIMGYHWGDRVRIEELFLKPSTKLQLQGKKSNVRGVDCYVLEADVPERGKYTVWIDPVHDFHIARIRVQRKSGDHIFGILLKQNSISKELFEVLEFEKAGDTWFPKTCKWNHENYDSTGYHSSEEKEISFTTITLNPDHDTPGSFLPDDIPNGTKAFLRASPDKEFTWQDGKPVPMSKTPGK